MDYDADSKTGFKNHFWSARKQQIWLHIKKKKISTVIYPSLKSYTSFERAYNNLSRKNYILPSWSP